MPGRNSSKRNFCGRGGQGFNNNNNDGRQKATTKKTLEDFTSYVSIAK